MCYLKLSNPPYLAEATPKPMSSRQLYCACVYFIILLKKRENKIAISTFSNTHHNIQ